MILEWERAKERKKLFVYPWNFYRLEHNIKVYSLVEFFPLRNRYDFLGRYFSFQMEAKLSL